MNICEQRLEVITSAPNQNREHFSEHLERLVPYFAARSLNRIVSMNRGVELLSVDMWNSFGHHMDESYKNQERFDGASREEYATLLLEEKYDFLENIGIDRSATEVARDDDPLIMDWIQGRLKDLFDQGIIYEDIESASVCVNCGNIIAVAVANVSACSRCNEVDVSIEKRKMLFMDLPGDRLGYLNNKIKLPRKSGFINGQFATLPGRVMVSRTRDYGQPLGVPGYEDSVLDPKIGLAFMPEAIANKFDIDTVVQVQGATTAKNTTPYTAILSPELTAQYIFTGNIPSDIDESRLNELGLDFFTKYLPIYMLDRVGNIDEAQLKSLSTEHSKVKRKIENAMHYLESNESESMMETPADISMIRSALGDIATYNVRRGVLNMRKYVYEDLGGQYVKNLRNHRKGVSSMVLGDIKEILDAVF